MTEVQRGLIGFEKSDTLLKIIVGINSSVGSSLGFVKNQNPLESFVIEGGIAICANAQNRSGTKEQTAGKNS